VQYRFRPTRRVDHPAVVGGDSPGITRALLLEKIAAAANIRMREAVVRPEDFSAMDECVLLSTTRDVAPVAAIDAVRFKVGPDTVTGRLKAAFADYARAYAVTHPAQRV